MIGILFVPILIIIKQLGIPFSAVYLSDNLMAVDSLFYKYMKLDGSLSCKWKFIKNKIT